MSLGNVKMVDYENSPLMLYTWIDGYTYFIDKFPGIWGNIGRTVGGIFNWIGETYTSFFGSDEDKEKKEQKDSGATKFPGMIDIVDESRKSFFDKVGNRAPRTQIDLDTYTLRTEAKDFFGNNRSNINYVYDIQGWIGRYGLPLNLLLTMHKATNAPDMLSELIKGTKYENGKYEKTKLTIELKEVKGVATLQITLPQDLGFNGKLYNASGEELKAPINTSQALYYKSSSGNLHEIKDKSVAVDASGNPITNAGGTMAIGEGNKFQRNGLYGLLDKGYTEDDVNSALKTVVDKFGKGKQSVEISKVVPLITDVKNHWYRDVYFRQKKGDKYVDLDADYLVKTGELWLERDKDGNIKEKQQEKDWSAYDPLTEKDKEDLKQRQTGGTEQVTNITAADVDDEEKTLIGSFLGANNTADLKEAIGKLRRNIWRK